MPSGTTEPAATIDPGRDPGAIEDDRTHPDQAVITDLAAMEDGAVSGHDACPDRAGISWVGMQNCAILNVGASPDRDPLGVATENGVEPDACFGSRGPRRR